MNVLILGSGGREHTLAWKISQSPLCTKCFVAPGNAGTHSIAENIDIDLLDFPSLGNFSIRNNIKVIIVGPEIPLVAGVVDYFQNIAELKSIKIIGPDKKGAQLEGSKDFSKKFMNKYGIPTATYKTFTIETIQQGLDYLQKHSLPIVLKADGLAAGKGVIIVDTVEEALDVFQEMLINNKFGKASAKVVVEEFLEGIELSVFVLCDGSNYILLPEAKDYKRIGVEDTGPNTGGMGAISPVSFATHDFMATIEKEIIIPTINGLKNEAIEYTGFIFFGIIKVKDKPYVIEYNARLGDPETEVIIPRIKSDFLELCIAAADKRLSHIHLDTSPETAATIMIVAGGYPDAYEKEDEITGLSEIKDVLIFHAGTKFLNNKVVTNGGRVLAVTSLGKDIREATNKSIKAAETINWKNKYYRKDIGLDLVRLSDN